MAATKGPEMTSELVRSEVRDGVAVVVLDDPARRNVLSSELVTALLAAYDRAESDPEVRVVVLAAAGPAFCAGAELVTLERAGAGDLAGVEEVYGAFLRVAESPLVTIAAVGGPAVGAGFNLALACDVRLASRAASFDARFVQMHLHPGGGHVWMLERAIGRQGATMVALFGERLDADAALRAGLVWRVYDDGDELLDAAVGLGARLRGHDRDFVRALTSTLRGAGGTAGHGDAVEHERRQQRWSMTRPRFQESIRAARRRIEGTRD